MAWTNVETTPTYRLKIHGWNPCRWEVCKVILQGITNRVWSTFWNTCHTPCQSVCTRKRNWNLREMLVKACHPLFDPERVHCPICLNIGLSRNVCIPVFEYRCTYHKLYKKQKSHNVLFAYRQTWEVNVCRLCQMDHWRNANKPRALDAL